MFSSKASRKRWCVVVRKSWTLSCVGEPRWYESKAEAVQDAADFNRHSQDSTWNCECAVVVDVCGFGTI